MLPGVVCILREILPYVYICIVVVNTYVLTSAYCKPMCLSDDCNVSSNLAKCHRREAAGPIKIFTHVFSCTVRCTFPSF